MKAKKTIPEMLRGLSADVSEDSWFDVWEIGQIVWLLESAANKIDELEKRND